MKDFSKSLLILWISMLGSIALVTIDDDPELWPGHLKPFGELQNFVKVEEIDKWPSPSDFFSNFVDKSRPMLFKGLAKKSPAFKLWDDDYLRDHPDSDEQLVYIEPEKKENRTKQGRVVSLKHFIDIYHNSSVYMVNGCPKNVMRDVLIPPPLRCEETRKFLRDAVTWFSSGGTKSVVHYDDLDNINCLFRGSKQLYFINNENYFDLFEWTDNGYATIDVEKVDYVKYPQLRFIHEYIKADMEAGDCVFIPFKWIHQVNSKANDKGQNVAVNIWFKHINKHRPKNCSIPEDDATIDKYHFSELEKTQAELEGKEAHQTKYSEKYESLLQYTKKGRMNFNMFMIILKKSDTLFGEEFEDLDIPEEKFRKLVENLFRALDFTQNGVFNVKDLDSADENGETEEYEKLIGNAEDELLLFIESLEQGIAMDGENSEKDKENVEKRANDEL